jgi:hypothetical protein
VTTKRLYDRGSNKLVWLDVLIGLDSKPYHYSKAGGRRKWLNTSPASYGKALLALGMSTLRPRSKRIVNPIWVPCLVVVSAFGLNGFVEYLRVWDERYCSFATY